MQFSCEMKVEEIVDFFFFVFHEWVFFLLSKFDDNVDLFIYIYAIQIK
jgi:hypothetical protein